MHEDILVADGFEEALIGVGRRCGQPDIAVYDTDKCIEVLMEQGMDREGAVEYFEYNVIGSWMGDKTPLFMGPPDELWMTLKKRD
tara:strand:- start:58 stop:312 length:255 start_codon:yes stop_codon:yes gene_type:complete